MSIYSGFGSRQTQTKYDQLILKLIFTLYDQLQALHAFSAVAFVQRLLGILSRLKIMEESKYLDPKIGTIVMQRLEKVQLGLKAGPTQEKLNLGEAQRQSFYSKELKFSKEQFRMKRTADRQENLFFLEAKGQSRKKRTRTAGRVLGNGVTHLKKIRNNQFITEESEATMFNSRVREVNVPTVMRFQG